MEASTLRTDFTASIVTGGGLRSRIEELRISYDPRCVDYFEDILKRRGSAFANSASGFLLLDSLLRKNKIDRLKTAILLDENKRPYIDYSDMGLDFSVSHSGGCALCVLAMGDGAAVGCDIQHARDYTEEKLSTLSRTFMNTYELTDFERSDDRSAEFFKAWTRREAYVKRVGSDIFDNLKTADLSGEYFKEGVIYACGERYFYSINTLYPPISDKQSEEGGEPE